MFVNPFIFFINNEAKDRKGATWLNFWSTVKSSESTLFCTDPHTEFQAPGWPWVWLEASLCESAADGRVDWKPLSELVWSGSQCSLSPRLSTSCTLQYTQKCKHVYLKNFGTKMNIT